MNYFDNKTSGIVIREMQPKRDREGFFRVLSQLSAAPVMPSEEFDLVHTSRLNCKTLVAFDNHSEKIVGTGSIIIEVKFSHYDESRKETFGLVGHVEDIVVDAQCRGLGIGNRIVQALVDHARSMGCYKIILDCKESNAGFYERLGFRQSEVCMRLDLSRE